MSTLKQFTFFVLNGCTKEIATFIGQGEDLESAWKDAIVTITGKFRPDSSGGGEVLPLNIKLPNGENVSRMKADFEGDDPYPEDEP